jgi:hypothetical protein
LKFDPCPKIVPRSIYTDFTEKSFPSLSHFHSSSSSVNTKLGIATLSSTRRASSQMNNLRLLPHTPLNILSLSLHTSPIIASLEVEIEKRRGNISQRGELPVQQSSQKRVVSPLPILLLMC